MIAPVYSFDSRLTWRDLGKNSDHKVKTVAPESFALEATLVQLRRAEIWIREASCI